jgi:hypothetical protein
MQKHEILTLGRIAVNTCNSVNSSGELLMKPAGYRGWTWQSTSRFKKVLTMVYNTQNHSNKAENNVYETGSVSVLRWGELRETSTLLSPLERAKLSPVLRLALCKGLNGVNVYLPSSEDRSWFSEMLCFLVFRISDDGQSPKSQWFWIQELQSYLRGGGGN